MSFDPKQYGPTVEKWLDTDRNRPLDAGTGAHEVRDELRGLSVDSIFADTQVADRPMAACCLAAIWLLYDFLDESHTISQAVHNPSGSFWHGIMHRREGDYSNAKYWFRQVGPHPIFPDLAEAATQLATDAGQTELTESLVRESRWDPFRFVDLCEAAVLGKFAPEPLLRDIQQAEWELLFDYCYRRATGGT